MVQNYEIYKIITTDDIVFLFCELQRYRLGG